MTLDRPLLPGQLVPNPLVESPPATDQTSKPASAALPDYLLNYAPAAAWKTVFPADLLEDNAPLPDNPIYLNSTFAQLPDPNLVFGRVRSRLAPHQYFALSVVTAENVKSRLIAQFSPRIFTLYYPLYFLVKRMLPKLTGLRGLSRLLNIRADVSKAEFMGRLIYKGFTVVDLIEETRQTTFIVKPSVAGDPSQTQPAPSEGFIIRMQRLGQYDRPIYVYKLRSMHPYAEYVQAYLHTTNGLDRGGKFKNDFRVITGGKVIRKYWLDELPMLYNLFRGDLKLIGVRPISEHYFGLYPAGAQAIRTRHKPGLLPPFYADLPQTFDEIVNSELTYLTAYEAAPFATDLRYFGRIMANILFRNARSQ